MTTFSVINWIKHDKLQITGNLNTGELLKRDVSFAYKMCIRREVCNADLSLINYIF